MGAAVIGAFGGWISPGVFDDGGLSKIELLRDDPRALKDHLQAHFDLSFMAERYATMSREGGLEFFFEEARREFVNYSEINGILILYCDAIVRLDPTPFVRLFEEYERTVVSKIHRFRQELPERDEDELKALRSEYVRIRHKGMLQFSPAFHEAGTLRERLRLLADLEIHRRLRSQSQPTATDLVTKNDVAAIVGLEPSSINRYVREWPAAHLENRGQLAKQWIYDVLRPTLVTQFSHLTIPYAPRHNGQINIAKTLKRSHGLNLPVQ